MGRGAALLDLRSAAGWPYMIAACGIGLGARLLGCPDPPHFRIALGWSGARTGQINSMFFYGLLPAALGTLLGHGLRKAATCIVRHQRITRSSDRLSGGSTYCIKNTQLAPSERRSQRVWTEAARLNNEECKRSEKSLKRGAHATCLGY